MMRRIALAVLMAASLGLGARARAAEMRPAIDRPEIMEVGDPILINRRMLAMEMRRNVDLRDWIHLYGLPDYAEVQEIQIEPPWASYEVRVYYLDRNAYLAFARVNVAPNVYDYGVRKYFGSIDPSVVERLLTAQPATSGGAVQPVNGLQTQPPVAMVVETIPVEGVPITN
jgi:hypothetical protein